MNGGLNVSPIEQRPPPWHLPVAASSIDIDCTCRPRVRGGSLRYVAPGDTIKLYSGGKAVSISAGIFDTAPFEGSDQPTPDDVDLWTYIMQGNAFLYIHEGRDEQAFSPTFYVTTTTDVVEVETNLEIRK